MNCPSRFLRWSLALTASALAATAGAQNIHSRNDPPDEVQRLYAQNNGWQRDHDMQRRPDMDRRNDRDWGPRRHDDDTYRRAEAWRQRQGPQGHGPRWERGQRYHGPVHVVQDYRHYRLRQPPRGYHWVQADDGNLLLVAIATGVILEIATH